MKKITIGLGDEEDFFERGRRIAKAADAGGRMPEDDAGIVLVERRVLPGHGAMKFLQVPGKKVVLQAVV